MSFQRSAWAVRLSTGRVPSTVTKLKKPLIMFWGDGEEARLLPPPVVAHTFNLKLRRRRTADCLWTSFCEWWENPIADMYSVSILRRSVPNPAAVRTCSVAVPASNTRHSTLP